MGSFYEVPIDKELPFSAGVAQLVEHRPSKPKKPKSKKHS